MKANREGAGRRSPTDPMHVMRRPNASHSRYIGPSGNQGAADKGRPRACRRNRLIPIASVGGSPLARQAGNPADR